MKQVWIAAYTSLLARMSPEDAVDEAHRALIVCNEVWRDPEWIWTKSFKGDQPVGTTFTEDARLPPNNAHA